MVAYKSNQINLPNNPNRLSMWLTFGKKNRFELTSNSIIVTICRQLCIHLHLFGLLMKSSLHIWNISQERKWTFVMILLTYLYTVIQSNHVMETDQIYVSSLSLIFTLLLLGWIGPVLCVTSQHSTYQIIPQNLPIPIMFFCISLCDALSSNPVLKLQHGHLNIANISVWHKALLFLSN